MVGPGRGMRALTMQAANSVQSLLKIYQNYRTLPVRRGARRRSHMLRPFRCKDRVAGPDWSVVLQGGFEALSALVGIMATPTRRSLTADLPLSGGGEAAKAAA